MNPLQISRDPIWHRWIDGVIVLLVGIVMGLVIAQIFSYYSVETTTTTVKSVRTLPFKESEASNKGVVDAPATHEGPKVEEG